MEYVITSKNDMVTIELPTGDKFRIAISPINELSIVKVSESRNQIFVIPETGNRITLK
jgi:hypothetical protein